MTTFRSYAGLRMFFSAFVLSGACIAVGDAYGQAGGPACGPGCYLVNWFTDGVKHWNTPNTKTCINWAANAPGGCVPPVNNNAFNCGNVVGVTVQQVFNGMSCCNGVQTNQDNPPANPMFGPKQMNVQYPTGCNIQKS